MRKWPNVFPITGQKTLPFRSLSWHSSPYWPESVEDFIWPLPRKSYGQWFPTFQIAPDDCAGWPVVCERCNRSDALPNYHASDATLTQWYSQHKSFYSLLSSLSLSVSLCLCLCLYIYLSLSVSVSVSLSLSLYIYIYITAFISVCRRCSDIIFV